MAKNTPPPACPKCGKPKKFTLVRTGGRKFRCIYCDLPGPVHDLETARWLSGELGKREWMQEYRAYLIGPNGRIT